MGILNFEAFGVSQRIVQALNVMFEHHRIPQALIIEGDCEKTERLAQTLAAAMVCCSDTDVPCGVCGGCVKAKAGSHPDIYTAQGGMAPRSFKVDMIRAVRSDAYIRSQEGGFKIYLLLRAQSMSAEAQNALLKVLEEPPAETVFILTCDTARSLLQTICSRAQIITLESDPVQSSEAKRIAGEIAQALLSVQEIEVLQVTAPLIKDKEMLEAVLEQLMMIFRDACVQRAGGAYFMSSHKEQVEQLCRKISQVKLFQLLEIIRQAQDAMVFHANMGILVTTLCTKLRAAVGR